ncbi:hypothetical protein Cha6605_0066 [Chamaesiphon minutus PCC 6605]|uniref:Uncharacterized protein n=1 Tax=Chamaesiphon minutus (strain ATCC 27169 / PCC 6605) TaxID=1173020 RepID=K9U9U3_CHAP6|nr:hypothetical protein Cha6605_0066 [Chamaesiphon minutus PCC 6605]
MNCSYHYFRELVVHFSGQNYFGFGCYKLPQGLPAISNRLDLNSINNRSLNSVSVLQRPND